MKELNYIILSNRANERVKSFKSLIKKGATYIFEKPISSKALNNTQKKIFKYYQKNKIKIKTGLLFEIKSRCRKIEKIIKKKNIIKLLVLI